MEQYRSGTPVMDGHGDGQGQDDQTRPTVVQESSGEAPQGVVIVDVNTAREIDWSDGLKKPFFHGREHRIAPPAVSGLEM